MRRVRRIIVDLAAVLALVACLATAMVWVRSYQRSDLVIWCGRVQSVGTQRQVTWWEITSSGGGLRITRAADTSTDGMHGTPVLLDEGWSWTVTRHTAYPSFYWFESERAQEPQADHVTKRFSIVFPIGCAALALALVPLLWLRRAARAWLRRGGKAGHCLGCSYDLTGNVSGVCPECGTPTTKPAG